MKPFPIRNKRDFFELWEKGLLGNRPPLWRNIDEVPWSTQRVGFREIGKAGGGAWTLVNRIEAERIWDEWRSLGRTFIMDGSVPNDHSTMQGEICRTYRGLESYLAVRDIMISGTRLNLQPPKQGMPPMRETMKLGWHWHRGGAATLALLDRHMDPSSRDDLNELLELYPDATVEFTCFDIDTGNIPNRNTIFWEVRNY